MQFRKRVGLVTVVFASITALRASAQTPQNLLVPLYFPSSSDLQRLIDAYPTASMTIADAGIGQGPTGQDSYLKSQIDAARAAGIKVYGYVFTRGGSDEFYGANCPHYPPNANSITPPTIPTSLAQ